MEAVLTMELPKQLAMSLYGQPVRNTASSTPPVLWLSARMYLPVQQAVPCKTTGTTLAA
jgi:hypothetical protein